MRESRSAEIRRVGRSIFRLGAPSLLLLCLLSACDGLHPLRLATPTSTATPTVATAMATPTATATVPSPTPSPTATASATPTATATSTPTPLPLTVEIGLRDPQVAQGHTLTLTAVTNQPSALSGQIEERQILFVSTDGLQHVAFVGIRAMAALGEEPLVITATTPSGQRLTLSTSIWIVSGNYGDESIPLTPGLSALLDPAITRPELLRLAEIYAQFTPTVRWKGIFDWPLQGPITSPFGTRRLYGNTVESYHAGLDIDGETGDEVRAPAEGVIALAEALKVRGNAVIIDHGAGVLSGCYHLERIDVEVGQFVERGTLLGSVGSTGLSTGSHLHWELRVAGVAVDAAEWTQIALLTETDDGH